MPNIAAALKAEIARVARKEMRSELEQLKKSTAAYRSAIAALKRQVSELERAVNKTGKAQAAEKIQSSRSEAETTRYRFSAKGLKTHRAKLGVSAADYGKLVGVSALSIYKWENGGVHPRAAQLAALARVRGLGKREALKRLESA